MVEVIESQTHVDPDAQATVTDFIDYTEHLPSDIRRSLALIDKLNELIYSCQDEVHILTKIWNKRVTATNGISVNEAARELRAKISYQKNLSSRYAAAALAEALRIDKEVARHQNLISITGVKLDALPLPPSRDPSPQPLQSPQATRAAGQTGPRIRLRIDHNRISAHTVRPHGTASRSRKRRVLIPGEVLPPPNPNSPSPSEISDWDSPPPPARANPRLEPVHRAHSIKPVRIRPLKPPKPPKSDVSNGPKKERPPRPAGVMGTNVHSSVAGISTSNALMLLTPPPNNATPGSGHAPWMRLTEYEMAKLRKRMKKNAIWGPSDTMIRRELNDAGRGPENYRKAKQKAEDSGESFLDVDDLVNKDTSRELQPGEINLDVKSKIFNKGMSLNVQKKEKKAMLQKQLAEQAKLEAELAAKNLGTLGDSFRTLFDRPNSLEKEKIFLKTPARKRKRDQSLTATEESQLHSQLHSEIIVTPTTATAPKSTKKRKPNGAASQTPTTPNSASALSVTAGDPGTTNTTITIVPLAAPAPSPIKATSSNHMPQVASPTATRRPETRRLSLVVRPPHDPNNNIATSEAHAAPASTTTPINPTRPPSRPASRRASAGPPSADFRFNGRRKSATPGPPLVSTLASSRSKRPAPGPVTNPPEGGNAISVGKRQKRPGKKGSAAAANSAKKVAEGAVGIGAVVDGQDEEEIDPNEPRYCICGDVSYGTMVMCENPDCEKEWFHLECVGLADIPSRRAKWWCPDCSLKLGKK